MGDYYEFKLWVSECKKGVVLVFVSGLIFNIFLLLRFNGSILQELFFIDVVNGNIMLRGGNNKVYCVNW